MLIPIKLWTKSLRNKTIYLKRLTKWTKDTILTLILLVNIKLIRNNLQSRCQGFIQRINKASLSKINKTFLCKIRIWARYRICKINSLTKENRSNNSKTKLKSKIKTWTTTWRQAKTCVLEKKWTMLIFGKTNKCNMLLIIHNLLLKIQVQTEKRRAHTK